MADVKLGEAAVKDEPSGVVVPPEDCDEGWSLPAPDDEASPFVLDASTFFVDGATLGGFAELK